MGNPVKYPMPVPERTRIIWVSAEAKALWAPRVQRITAAWSAVERASVGHFRFACRQTISPEDLPLLSEKAAESGRGLLVIGQQASGGMYSSRATTLDKGQSWAYNIVLAEDLVAAKAFAIASKAGDNAIMGDLLGYPPCCIKFFEQAWVKEKYLDTTWPMIRSLGENTVEFKNIHIANNILLRWLGIRLVPHLPCSFECSGTTAFGNLFGLLMDQAFPEEWEWMQQLLGANIEWSAIKGTAEIRLPILKIATTTDALTEPVSVKLLGHSLEAESKGNVFPWPASNAVPNISPMTFHKKHTLDTDWKDNGFNSLEGMRAAHQMVRTHFDALRLKFPSVLDLGCGNGMLANMLSSDATGVEIDKERADQARTRLKAVHTMSIQEFIDMSEEPYDVVLIANQRLLEMSPDERWDFMAWSNKHAYMLIYDYSANTVITKTVRELV